MFKVILTKEFKIIAKKLFSKYELKIIKNTIKNELIYNADTYGDSLSYKFLREFKIKGKRIYFLVYKDICIVLVISASNKKDQKSIVRNIKKELDKFKDLAYKFFNQK